MFAFLASANAFSVVVTSLSAVANACAVVESSLTFSAAALYCFSTSAYLACAACFSSGVALVFSALNVAVSSGKAAAANAISIVMLRVKFNVSVTDSAAFEPSFLYL